MFEIEGIYTTAKVMIDQIEDSCKKQIETFVNNPNFTNHIAVMPDAHTGIGTTIGFTMPMTRDIIPNVVGVDIGCGMLSANIGSKLPIGLDQLDYKCRKNIPFGENVHESEVIHLKTDFPWHETQVLAEKFARRYNEQFGTEIKPPKYSETWFTAKCVEIGINYKRALCAIGSVGGGNHFVETGIDESGDYWFSVHSGSRNFGKRVCDFWSRLASKKEEKRIKDSISEQTAAIKATFTGNKQELKAETNRIKKNMNEQMQSFAALSGTDAEGYLFDMIFCQMYAALNRREILKLMLKVSGAKTTKEIETVHNYIDFEDFIIRKGAIRSYEGEQMVIPINMRDGILLCEGKSNAEWNFSAPHGAGRVLSRAQARESISVEKFKSQMDGIFSSSVGEGTVDEAPDAYKRSAVIEYAIEPTAKLITKIKPVHNMKDPNARIATLDR